MKKIWAFLNGNKTIIGTSLIGILGYCPLPQPWQGIALAVVSIFTGVGAVHHAKKGYFSTRK